VGSAPAGSIAEPYGALAAALLRVLTEPGLAKRLAAAAAERARSLPGEEAAVDAVLADYTCAAGP